MFTCWIGNEKRRLILKSFIQNLKIKREMVKGTPWLFGLLYGDV